MILTWNYLSATRISDQIWHKINTKSDQNTTPGRPISCQNMSKGGPVFSNLDETLRKPLGSTSGPGQNMSKGVPKFSNLDEDLQKPGVDLSKSCPRPVKTMSDPSRRGSSSKWTPKNKDHHANWGPRCTRLVSLLSYIEKSNPDQVFWRFLKNLIRISISPLLLDEIGSQNWKKPPQTMKISNPRLSSRTFDPVLTKNDVIFEKNTPRDDLCPFETGSDQEIHGRDIEIWDLSNLIRGVMVWDRFDD